MELEDVCNLCFIEDVNQEIIYCNSCNLSYHKSCVNYKDTDNITDFCCINCNIDKLNIKETSKTVVVYQRVSSKNQDDSCNGKVGLETQNFMILDYCKNNNLTILKTYKDVGSAKNINNLKNLKLLIQEIKPNVDIITYSASRISRNCNDFKTIIEKLHTNNNRFYSVVDNLHSDDEKFMLLIETAEKESNKLSTIVKDSIRRRKQLGGHIGKAPYGYCLQRDRKGVNKLKIDKTENDVIKYILYNLNNKLKTAKEIAEHLNNENKLKRKLRWTTSSVLNIKKKHNKVKVN